MPAESAIAVDEPTLKPLDTRVQRVWVVDTILGSIVALAILSMLELFYRMEYKIESRLPVYAPVVTLLFLTQGIARIRAYYRSWRYGLDDHALTVQFGLWTRRRISLPRARIQNVEIQEGPWDRRFGIQQLIVHTAGTESITIPGLIPGEAEHLRNELLRTATRAHAELSMSAEELLHP